MSPGTESSPTPFPHLPDGIEIAEDAWLGERFGHPVFTVRVVSEDADIGYPLELEELDTLPELATYQTRIDASKPALAADTFDFFEVVGATLTLARPTGAEDLPLSPVTVRPGDPGSDAAVGEIAGRAFVHSRFHADPHIPNRVADAIKRDWALNLLSGERGDGVWVAEQDGSAVGFLGRVKASEGAAVIDLVAVDPDARSAGAGAALVRHFLDDARERGEDRARVGTQIANPRALAFYERLGFRAQRSELDLHGHWGDVWPDQ